MEKFGNDGKKWKPGLAAFPGGLIEHLQALWGFRVGVRKGWAFWENLAQVAGTRSGGKKWWRW